MYITIYASNPLSPFLITFLNPPELLQLGSNLETTSDTLPFRLSPLYTLSTTKSTEFKFLNGISFN